MDLEIASQTWGQRPDLSLDKINSLLGRIYTPNSGLPTVALWEFSSGSSSQWDCVSSWVLASSYHISWGLPFGAHPTNALWHFKNGKFTQYHSLPQRVHYNFPIASHSFCLQSSASGRFLPLPRPCSPRAPSPRQALELSPTGGWSQRSCSSITGSRPPPVHF